ncbi:HAD family hydrolase [Alkalicoccus chagannorensis]|uniref:HAD family hydrolase n=1 Tax=Alkalicoccus chagannorensis TaxID=427072 RepID=UPI0003F73101|nr:HAD family hydrolase [Alkalicoccus chagannorensis]
MLYIFDLDGTLYSGREHFDYYASLLKQDVQKEAKGAFEEDYEAMKRGDHPVKIGRAYSPVRDEVVQVDPYTSRGTKVVDWYGRPVETSPYEAAALTFDFTHLAAIGDGWWLPFAAASHHGVTNIQRRYHETKDYMASDSFQLTSIPGLPSFLRSLTRNHSAVLVTNSDLADTERILRELGLEDSFHEKICSAGKPRWTKSLFADLLRKYDVEAEEAVSIGDNLLNDVAPAVQMGMKGIYIGEGDHKPASTYASLEAWMEDAAGGK